MTPLRQRMLEDMGVRNLAKNTQSAYVQQVAVYARHFQRSPEDLGPDEVRAYQVHLTQTRKLSPSTIGVATGALRFLYKVTLKRDWALEAMPMPRKSFRLPVILSREEVRRFLDSVDSLKHRAVLMTAYAAGLRVSEATHLKVTDIDSQRMTLRVDQGKGRKDRYVMLSARLLDLLRVYWKAVRPTLWLFPVELAGQPICRVHVLPNGLQRIRHYGLLANRHRVLKLARCRQLLASIGRIDPTPYLWDAGPFSQPSPVSHENHPGNA